LPDVRAVATRLRARLLEAETPTARVFAAALRARERPRRLTIESARLVSGPARP
jgi:hypothetical protein